MIDHTQREHSPIGASSSERWFNCPASIKLGEGIEQKTSVYAEEGTAAHELAEHCLVEGVDAKECLELTFNGFNVTEEMAEAVQVYVDYIRNLQEGMSDPECNIEVRFSLDHIDKELFGTNDCSVFDYESGDLHVIDYKHGAGKLVEADENSQLLYYALGVYKDLPYVNDIYLTIVQPRRLDGNGDAIRTWKTDAKVLTEFQETLKQKVQAVRKVYEAKDPYNYAHSGNHCTFCPVQPTCKKLHDNCLEVAAIEFDDGEPTLPTPDTLSPEQLAKVLSVSKMISSWVDSVKSHALERAQAGHKIEGFKLVQGKANRKWKDESEVISELDMLYGDDIYTPKKLRSPAQMEKLTGDKEFIARFTEKPAGAISLVPQKDKRKEIPPSAVQDFQGELDV